MRATPAKGCIFGAEHELPKAYCPVHGMWVAEADQNRWRVWIGIGGGIHRNTHFTTCTSRAASRSTGSTTSPRSSKASSGRAAWRREAGGPSRHSLGSGTQEVRSDGAARLAKFIETLPDLDMSFTAMPASVSHTHRTKRTSNGSPPMWRASRASSAAHRRHRGRDPSPAQGGPFLRFSVGLHQASRVKQAGAEVPAPANQDAGNPPKDKKN